MEKTVTNTIVIQRGVPLPGRAGHGHEGTSVWSKLADQMTEGDSVLLDSKKAADNLGSAIRKRGWRSAQRRQGNSYRVWCVERKAYSNTDPQHRDMRTNGHARA